MDIKTQLHTDRHLQEVNIVKLKAEETPRTKVQCPEIDTGRNGMILAMNEKKVECIGDTRIDNSTIETTKATGFNIIRKNIW